VKVSIHDKIRDNKVSGDKSEMIKPGDQAEITYASAGAKLVVKRGIDLKKILDWKRGIYRFEAVDLREIMRVLERAYDVTIQYQPDMTYPALIDGALDLNRGIDVALKQLEGSYYNKIHLLHNGKAVIVSSI
jgi:transmembrane sensor